MRSLGDDEVLSLPIAVAEAMPDDALRTIFVEMVVTLDGEMGDSLPKDFPREPWDMPREEILAAVRKYPYWFDYYGYCGIHPSEQPG